jgi:hypothetical protein
VVIIGTPAGAIGVNSKAKAIAAAVIKTSRFFLILGQTNPQNAAGTAASNPHAAGSPIALAPRAPKYVNKFQCQ